MHIFFDSSMWVILGLCGTAVTLAAVGCSRFLVYAFIAAAVAVYLLNVAVAVIAYG